MTVRSWHAAGKDWLAEKGLPVVPFNGSDRAVDPDRLANLRAEAYWQLREDLRRGFAALPGDERLAEELGGLRWQPDARGRIHLEAKTKLSAWLGRSPERSDATAMAFYPRIVGAPGAEVRGPGRAGREGFFQGIPAGEVGGSWL